MQNAGGRHELKHYINYADLLQLKSRLSQVTHADKNTLNGDGYRVRSLYFDNYTDKVLREKIDGVNGREKFRLRLYNDDSSFIRLEKKSKKNGICFKSNAVIKKEECKEFLNGNLNVLKENGHPLLMELYAKMHYQQLKPKNIVDYKRDAYIFYAGNVRVTLDYDIRTSMDTDSFLETEMITVPIPEVIILEVKYDHFLPELIRGIVTLSSRSKTAFSKYAATRII